MHRHIEAIHSRQLIRIRARLVENEILEHNP
jgi:hypothetical protein